MPWLCPVFSQRRPRSAFAVFHQQWVGWEGRHSLCMEKKPLHLRGSRDLEAVRSCLTAKTAFLMCSDIYLMCSPSIWCCPPICNGLWLQPLKDHGNFGVCSQLRICPGLYSGLQQTCWRLSWLNVGDGRSVQMHSLECVFSAKREESCPHGSGNFK